MLYLIGICILIRPSHQQFGSIFGAPKVLPETPDSKKGFHNDADWSMASANQDQVQNRHQFENPFQRTDIFANHFRFPQPFQGIIHSHGKIRKSALSCKLYGP